MKQFQRRIAFILALAMLLCFAGCQKTPTPSPAASATEPPPEAAEVYAQLVQPLKDSPCLEVKAEISKTTAVGSDRYSKESALTLLWNGRNTEQLQVKVSGSTVIGEDKLIFSETYRDGTVYVKFQNQPYFSETALEDFTARWPSAIPLQEELYGSVTQNEEGFLFADASAVEGWAAPEYAQLTEAGWQVTLDDAGAISGYRYTAKYLQGSASVELDAEFTVKSAATVNTTLDIPANDKRYVPVEDPAALHLFWESQIHLPTVSALTSSLHYTIASEVVGVQVQQLTDLARCGQDSDYAASIDMEIQFAEYNHWSNNFDTSTYSRQELYQNGEYSLTENGSSTSADETASQAAMAEGFDSVLLEHLPTVDGAIALSYQDLGGIGLIEVKYNNLVGQAHCNYIFDILLEDSSILNRYASSYKTQAMTGYLAINLDTGFPTGSGMDFACTHTIEGETYSSTYQAAQSFCLSDPGAFEAITGEALQDPAPENPATPLFYQVSGAGGQKMWLLGTIHVGDSRTAHLPREIYDAMDGSAALAVEFDDEAFAELLEADETLAVKLAAQYYYTDGSTITSHIDASLYAEALSLMKATGMPLSITTLLKPVVWGQTIDDLYLSQGYRLFSSKGVDARLMEHARANDIPIRDVESGTAQLEMLMGFSDNVQEMLLASSVYTSLWEYNRDLTEMYELWCQGDEAALTAFLESEDENIPNYLADAYNEYTRAMMTDRNKDMADVATSYLESGEVIFYAVGLAHLLGEDGLVNALRQAGYTVEPVKFAP